MDDRKHALIPRLGSQQARERHDDKLWRMFARRAQRNPHIKAFVLKRDDGRCPWCGKRLHPSAVLHHIDYDHHCHLGEEIRIPRAHARRENSTTRVPDCERCHAEHPDFFEGCASRLVAVHQLCNAAIEAARAGALTSLPGANTP